MCILRLGRGIEMGGLKFDFCTVVGVLLVGKEWLPCCGLGGFVDLFPSTCTQSEHL